MYDQADEERRRWFRTRVLPLEHHLRRYARRFARRDHSEVEDLVHETFARVIAHEGWRNVDSPLAFSCRILKNIALDASRRAKIATFDAIDHVDPLALVDSAPNPEITVLYRDQLERLREIIERLPTPIRRAFTLRKVYGMSPKRIAETLGLSVSTVEKHLSKGLRICSEQMAEGDALGGAGKLEHGWATKRDRRGIR
jgi:RNA polymerase sigma-70 factor (ECF subfamily)